MDRDQLLKELKQQILTELKEASSPITDKITPHQKKVFKDTKEELEHLISEHPLAAVALAGAAGFLLAKLIYNKE